MQIGTDDNENYSPTPDTYPLSVKEIIAQIAPIPSVLDGPLDKEAQNHVWKIIGIFEETIKNIQGTGGRIKKGIPSAALGPILNTFLERCDVDALRKYNHLDILQPPTEEEAERALKICEKFRDTPETDLLQEGLVSIGRQMRVMTMYIEKWRGYEKLIRLFPKEYSIEDSIRASQEHIQLVKMVEQPPKFSLSWIEAIAKKQEFIKTFNISTSVQSHLGTQITLDDIIRKMSPKVRDNDPSMVKIAKNEQRIVAERVRSLFKLLSKEKQLQPDEAFAILAAYLELDDIKKIRSSGIISLFDPPTEEEHQQAMESYKILSTASVTDLCSFGNIYLNYLMNRMNSYAEKWRAQRKFDLVFREGLTLRETLTAALANPELMKGRENPPGFDPETVDSIREKMNVIARNSILSNLMQNTRPSGGVGYKRK